MRRRAVNRAHRWRQRSAADCVSRGPCVLERRRGWRGDGDLCSASRGELPVDPADGPYLPISPPISARSRQSIQPTAHHLRSSRISSERRSCSRRSGHQLGAVGGRPRGTVEGEAPRESTMTKLRPAAARRGRRSCTPRVQRAEGCVRPQHSEVQPAGVWAELLVGRIRKELTLASRLRAEDGLSRVHLVRLLSDTAEVWPRSGRGSASSAPASRCLLQILGVEPPVPVHRHA